MWGRGGKNFGMKSKKRRRNSSKISSDDTKKESKMEQDLIYGDRKSRNTF